MPPAQLSTMLDRESFLATGLVPVLSILDDTVCCICHESENPLVRLPCHQTHIYCRECLDTWLISKDYCALCHRQLFRSSPVERAINILTHQGPMNTMQSFGAGPFNDSNALLEASRLTQWFVAQGRPYRGRVMLNGRECNVKGKGLISTDSLAPRFAAMGNFIPALVEGEGVRFTAAQHERWEWVLAEFWYLLKKWDGKKMKVSPKKLKKEIYFEMVTWGLPDEVDEIEFFHQPGWKDLLRCMLDFVCFLAKRELMTVEAEKKIEKKLRRGRKWERRLLSRVGVL